MPVSRYTPPNGGYGIEVVARTRHDQGFASGMGSPDARDNLQNKIAQFYTADIFALTCTSTLSVKDEISSVCEGYTVGHGVGNPSTEITVRSRYISSPAEERQSIKAGIELKGAEASKAVEEMLYKRAVALEAILIDGVKFRVFLGRQ